MLAALVDVRLWEDSVAKVGRVARLGPFFEFLIVGFAFPSGKTDKPPPSTLTPRMLLALAAHDRGIWPTASSSVPLRSAAPRPWRHSSLVSESIEFEDTLHVCEPHLDL